MPTFFVLVPMSSKKVPRLKANFDIDAAKKQRVVQDWLKLCPKHDGRYNLPQLLQELEPVVLDILLD